MALSLGFSCCSCIVVGIALGTIRAFTSLRRVVSSSKRPSCAAEELKLQVPGLLDPVEGFRVYGEEKAEQSPLKHAPEQFSTRIDPRIRHLQKQRGCLGILMPRSG